MSEPLQEWVIQRLRDTQARALLTRMVDMPAVSKTDLVGTLSIRPRPGPPAVTCAHCGVAFRMRRHNQKFCDAECYVQYWRLRGAKSAPGQKPRLDPGICITCSAPFKRKDKTHKYCSRKCYQIDWARTRAPAMRAAAMEPFLAVEPSAIRRVIKIVAEVYGVPRDTMMGRTRIPAVAHPRQAAMALARDVLGANFCMIGRVLDRDHTSIIHGRRVALKHVDEDAKFGELYREAEARCRAALASRQAEGT